MINDKIKPVHATLHYCNKVLKNHKMIQNRSKGLQLFGYYKHWDWNFLVLN